MILIIANNHYDEPTNKVLDWLFFYDANFMRINGENYTPKNDFTVNLTKHCLKNNNQTIIKENNISVVWYRRWFNPSIRSINFEGYLENNFGGNEILLIESYQGFLNSELSSYTNGIFSILNNKTWIPNVHLARGGLNKIDVLIRAKRIGLTIPETIITTSKTELLEFYNKNGGIITKPISDVAPVYFDGTAIAMFTKEVTKEDINSFSDLFYPSLFQKSIEKSFEVRVFVYKKHCFSIAIFSQNDCQTKIDFRNYNGSKPNRNVPFKLPKEIENKLFLLFDDLKLNTGSVDLIVNHNCDFIFLEINPVGQFGMVSVGGNYPLEKIIAKDLIKTENEYKRNRENK
jgi:ATP-GRASP peptide maturase of grasp-with-spasm system